MRSSCPLWFVALLALPFIVASPAFARPGFDAQSEQSQPPPSGTAPGQAVPPGEGAKLEPAQLNDLLHKVYLAAFRFGDLLSVVQTDKWKMDDAARQSFNQTLEATRGELRVLDESRQLLQQKPENSEVADKVDASLTTLLPSIEAVAAAVTQYDSPAQGAQYRQPGDQLRELQKSLRPYVLYLHAKAEGVLAPVPGVQTEVIQPSSAQPTPPSGAAPGQAVPPGEGAKLEPTQLNDLLHKVYLAAFRFGDLLSVVQTDKWKMDDAARQSFNQTLEATRGELRVLDESRQLLQQKPENSEAADKVDASLTTLLPSIEVVAAAVTQYDSPAQGAQYRQPGDQLRELQKSLRPYVLYLHAKAEGVLAPIPGVQTEVIQPSSAQPTPPSGAAPGQAVPPGEGAKLEPVQLNDLLHKVYLAAFRFSDLLSVVQTDKWKMDDAARQSFNKTLEATRGELRVLDESRQLLQQKPENSEVADKVDASLTTLLPSIEAVAAAVTQYDSPAQGAQYRQPGDQLRELRKSLRPYVLYLHAKAEGVLAPIPGVQTEVIQSSSTPRVSQPADTSSPPPPLQPEQLKQILYKMYVPAFRVQDLLGQMQPEKWNASEAERSSFSQARAGLQAKLIEFEKVRNQFAASPATADLAFQTYLSALNVQEPLEQVSRSLSAYGETKLADEFRQRGRELITAQQELVPYISYFLGRWDRAVQMFQSNLAACQNQLGYAMHLRTQVATPLPNVNPEFQGRGRKAGSGKETATKGTATKPAKKTPPKKTSKKSSKPSPTRPDAPKT